MKTPACRHFLAAAILVVLPKCVAGTSRNEQADAANAAATSASTVAGVGQAQLVYSYVAIPISVTATKLKRFLVHTPCAQAELDKTAADANALSDLVDQWINTDAYTETMRFFFADAFQQSQVTSPVFTLLDGTSGPEDVLLQNMRESFGRTVVALNAQKVPFNQGIITKQLMMTTGLMAYYGLIDNSAADDRGWVYNRCYDLDPNWHYVLEKSKGHISLQDTDNPNSANYMMFYDPNLVESIPATPILSRSAPPWTRLLSGIRRSMAGSLMVPVTL